MSAPASAADLLDLAMRVETESHGQAFNAIIWDSVGLTPLEEEHCRAWCGMDGRADLRRSDFLRAWARDYTSSVDAALTLIPDGLYWIIAKGRARPDEPLYAVVIFRRPPDDVNPVAQSETNNSLAAATCAAALRARALS